MKVRFILFALIMGFLSTNLSAQSAGINFTLALPQGEFDESVDNLGYGLSGDFMFLTPRKGSPFGMGINAGFIIYGQETRRERFSLTIPDVFVDVTRSNNIANFHLLFRVAPPMGRFIPYLEGLFGGAYFFTETSIEGDYNNETIASSINFDDFAWSYGAGIGISYLVSGNPVPAENPVYIDLKARYLFGSEAEYLKEGSVELVNGRIVYNVSESKTDLLTIHLGVIVFFGY